MRDELLHMSLAFSHRLDGTNNEQKISQSRQNLFDENGQAEAMKELENFKGTLRVFFWSKVPKRPKLGPARVRKFLRIGKLLKFEASRSNSTLCESKLAFSERRNRTMKLKNRHLKISGFK